MTTVVHQGPRISGCSLQNLSLMMSSWLTEGMLYSRCTGCPSAPSFTERSSLAWTTVEPCIGAAYGSMLPFQNMCNMSTYSSSSKSGCHR